METSQSANPAQPDLSQLQQQHRDYDQQLSALASKPYLSADEEIEETRLKKLKLHVKDQISERQN